MTLAAPLIVALDDPRACAPELTGGKGSALARARAAGLPVPPGFCVTTAAFDARTRAPAGVEAEVVAAWRGLVTGEAEPRVAVRSSAVGEDGREASFAGIYESVLGVRDEQALLAALARVWASYDGERATAYRRRAPAGPERGAMAVVVQRLVPCTRAGVLFTVHPATGDRGRMLVEGTWGLGEGVVGSDLAADAWELGRTGTLVIDARIADKDRQVVLDPGAGPVVTAVPEPRRRAPCLGEAELAALRSLGARAEALMGGPQDLEWGFSGLELHLLQLRPISGLPEPHDASPWRPLEGPGGEPFLPLDLALKSRFLRALERGMFEIGSARVPEHRAVEGFVFTREVAAPEPALREARARTHRERLEACWREGTTIWERELEARVRAITTPLLARDLAALTADALRRHLFDEALPAYEELWRLHWHRGRELHEHWFRGYVELTGLRDELDARSLVASPSLVTRLDDELAEVALRVRENAGLCELLASEAGPSLLARLRERAAGPGPSPARELLAGLERLCERFPHQGTHRSFRDRVWCEDPGPALDLVRRRVLAGPEPDDERRAGASARRHALAARARAAAGDDPEAVRRLDALLELGRKATREQGDHHVLLDQAAHGLVRLALREVLVRLVAAGLVADEEALFLLEEPELDEALAALARGSVEGLRPRLAAAVTRRRAEHARRGRLRPAPRSRDLAHPFADGPERPVGAVEPAATEAAASLSGVAASAGRARGVVRLMLDSRSPPQLVRGDVLVARDVGPQWTPLFPMLGGLVLDGGAVLRHAATIAREYGIPAVIQTRRATQLLREGELVTVDGDRGLVVREP